MTILLKLDVNARHRPRTCQDIRNNAWALSSLVSALALQYLLLFFGTTDSHGLALKLFWLCCAPHCVPRRQRWVSTEAMASSDDDDQMRNKVEDILAATAPEHVVYLLCDEVIPEGCKSLSPGLFGCKLLDKGYWAALKSLQRLTLKNSDMKAKAERCRASDMDKFMHRPLFADG